MPLLALSAPVLAAPLAVTVVDALDGSPFAGLRVDLYERLADGRAKWRARAESDSSGRLQLELALGDGATYFLRARPFGANAYSGDIVQAGRYRFALGQLQMRLVSGANGRPMASTEVHLRERMADGKLRWVGRGKTDGDGLVRLDPPGLGTGRVFIARAKGLVDGRWKSSQPITKPGRFEFEVGNKPLLATLVEAHGGGPLAGQRIDAYQREGDRLRWRGRAETDGSGQAVFDIAGLGEPGGEVWLRARPFGTHVTSSPVEAPGKFLFEVGQVRLELVRGDNGEVYGGTAVHLRELLASGKTKWVAGATTDARGVARLDPRGGAAGRKLVAMARSPVTGRWKTSAVLEVPGVNKFVVGNAPLQVFLFDALTDPRVPIAGARIDAYERMGGGKLKWRGRAETDAGGMAALDIDRLGEPDGPTIVLSARPFGPRVYSAPVKAPGKVEMPAGALTLKLVSGASGEIMPGARVSLREVLDDGKQRWVGHAVTSADGVVRMDPQGLGTGRRFVAKAPSPVNGQWKTSEVYDRAGRYEFIVGNKPLLARVVNGVTGKPLAGLNVVAYEQLADGGRRWSGRMQTDDDGVVVFDLDGLGAGRAYFLRTRPYNAGHVDSEVRKEPGRLEMRVGTVPVTLFDTDEDKVVPGARLIAYRLDPTTEKLRWHRSGYTDDEGVVHFDLPGVSPSTPYVIKAYDPFGKKRKFMSKPIVREGPFRFLISRRDDLVDPEIEISTPAAGAEVPGAGFDISGEATDNVGVEQVLIELGDRTIEAKYDPSSKRFEAKVPGPLEGGELRFVAVALDADDNRGEASRTVTVKVDTIAPTVEIASPAEGDEVSSLGFAVSGTVADDEAVASVVVEVGGNAVDATVSDAGQFRAAVPGPLTGTVTFTVAALDAAGNRGEATRTVRAVDDTTAPSIAIVTPPDGSEVSQAGFTVSGTASDNRGVVSIAIALDDVEVLTVTVAGDGSWTADVPAGPLVGRTAVQVTATALDAAGNQTSAEVDLTVAPVDLSVRQLINRITFGPTAELLRHVDDIGAAAYLEEQLDPSAIDDSELEAILANLDVVDGTTDLQTFALLHAIHSRRQLREVMTTFWDNHFSTDLRADNSGVDNTVEFELAEHQAFRANALGRFRDLLGVSARSPSMLIYLDSISNIAGDPNENYPRELLELHTVGIDGGYTQEDVEEAARAFTGWQLQGGAFFFNSAQHDSGRKEVMGLVINPGGGESDGVAVLDYLAAHPSTARFICGKLIELLVDDSPPASVQPQCETAFLGAADQPDQIAQVVRAILTTPEFNGAAHFRSKVKTPLEFVAGYVRALDAEGDSRDLPGHIRRIGLRLFEFPVPTGYSERGDDWINSTLLLERIKFVDAVAFAMPNGRRTAIRPLDLVTANGATSAESILALLFDLAVGSDYTQLEWDTAMGVLTDYGLTPFDITNADADARIRAVIGTIFAYPGYQFH